MAGTFHDLMAANLASIDGLIASGVRVDISTFTHTLRR